MYYTLDYRTPEVSEVSEDTISGSGGGGGSCFPAGTMVLTAHGYKPIERIIHDDIVLAYDKNGTVDYGIVVEVFQHLVGTFPDDLYFIYSENINLFPKGITGNHAVYDINTNEHKEIKDFSIGDYLTLSTGTLVPITSIRIVPNEDISEDTYNFIVYPQHTYFVGSGDTWVKVHNGGGGGKSGGSPRAAQEAPNTLKSSAIAKVLEVISHGQIVGVVGGAKGFFINNTVLENADNSLNYAGVSFDQRFGLPSQSPIPGFEVVENTLAVPHTVITTSVTRDLINSNVQSATVILQLDEGLWSSNTSNGDLNGYSVSYRIETQIIGTSTWQYVFDKTLNDKSTTVTQLAHIVTAPIGTDSSSHWRIRVTRTSAVDGTSSTKSVLSWVGLIERTEIVLSYDKIAYVGIKIPAEAVGNSVPTREYLVQGIICRVPSNYDPVSRTYGTSYWDGSFKDAWTDNPAWVLYDIISNTEYGLQNYLGQSLDIDIWAFYEASLYNDCVSWNGSTYSTNLISDFQGGFERRFTFNAVIPVQSDAWQLLFAIASVMRAVPVDRGGEISLIQDRPRVPAKIFNTSNVINGTFLYSSTDISTRTTSINVTFNDKLDNYLPKTISEPGDSSDVNDPIIAQAHAAIAKFGLNTKDAVAYASVTESQARRLARWALYTDLNQFDTVSFSVALNIVDVEVGQVISILDEKYISDNNFYLSGRVISVSGATIIVDTPITFDTGHTYKFGVMSLDYSAILEVNISTTAGTYTTITTSSTLPVGDYVNHEFFCYSTGYIEPRQFLIQSITENSKGLFSIAGIFFDPNKFDIIEDPTHVSITPPVYTAIFSTVIHPVENITFSEVFMNDGIASHNYIDVKWDWNLLGTCKDAVTYNLKYRRDNGNYINVSDIAVKDFHIPDTTPGIYDVIVEVISLSGKHSMTTLGQYAYRTTSGISTLDAPTNFYTLGTVTTVFTGTHIPLTWTFNPTNSTKTDTLLDYVLEVWSIDNLTLLNSYIVQPEPATKNGSFDYLLQYNINDYGTPNRDVHFKLYSRDMIGDVSIPSVKVFTNAVPGVQSFTVLSGTVSVYINIAASSETDIAGYKVWRSLSSWTAITDFGVSEVYSGPDTYITLNVPTVATYYYRIAAYDSFGTTGLTLSSQSNSTPLSITGDVWTQSGIVFSVTTPTSNILAWTGGTIIKNGTSYTIASGTASWTSGTLYAYFNPGVDTTHLGTTGTLGIAVATGAWALAAYTGGDATHIKGGDGSAFINGSQIIAGTVGASELIVGSAVITETVQIKNAIITNSHLIDATIDYGKISDTLQSTNYSTVSHTGWRLNKTGGLTAHDLTILDSTGATVLASGSKVDFANLTGSTKPDNNATFGASLGGDFVPGTLTLNTTGSTGTVTVVGSPPTVTKTAGTTAFDSQAYSTESFTNAGAIRWKFGSTTLVSAVGIDTVPTGAATAGSLDFSIRNSSGVLNCYNSGTLVFTGPAFVVADLIEIEYIGTEIRYKQNSTIIHTETTTAGQTFFFDSSLNQVGATFNSVALGTYSAKNLTGLITPSNASTYIAAASIGTAFIQDLAVTNGKIAHLAVDTLQIAGNAVVIPVISIDPNVVVGLSIGSHAIDGYHFINSVTLDMTGGAAGSTILLEHYMFITSTTMAIIPYDWKIEDEIGTVLYTSPALNTDTLSGGKYIVIPILTHGNTVKTFSVYMRYYNYSGGGITTTYTYNSAFKATGVKSSV